MIFSSSKWNNASEIRPYISVARSTSFASLEAPLRNAFESFIRKLLGDTLTEKVIEYYNSSDANDKQKRLIALCQSANAFLAFWSEYDEMQLLIDDSGSHRQESENEKTPFKYQEQRIRNNWREKGFNALDGILAYLELNLDVFPEFKDSTNYTVNTKIVRNTADVNEFYWINNSRILFLRLKPHFKIVTDTIIIPRITKEIYDSMIESLSGTDPEAKYKELRKVLVPVVVFYSVSRLLKESGSLTERGMFFENLKSSDDDFNSNPLSLDQLAPQISMAEADAISYWNIVEKYMKANFNYTTPVNKKMPNFNNNDKKSFWT